MMDRMQRFWAIGSFVAIAYGITTAVEGIWLEKAVLGNGLPVFEISPLYPYLNYAVAPESLLTVSLFGAYLFILKLKKEQDDAKMPWKAVLMVPFFAGVSYDAYWTLLRYYSGLKPAPLFVAQLPIFWAVAIGASLLIMGPRIDRKHVSRGLGWYGVIGAYILCSQLFFPSLDTRAPLEVVTCLAVCDLFCVSPLPKMTPYRKAYLKKLFHAHSILAVSAPINYTVVVVLVIYTKFAGWWIVGPVAVGDIAGMVVNWLLATKTKLIKIEEKA